MIVTHFELNNIYIYMHTYIKYMKFSIFKKLFLKMAKTNCDKKFNILILGNSSVGKVWFYRFNFIFFLLNINIILKNKELYFEKIC
jgi:hypothetical protein